MFYRDAPQVRQIILRAKGTRYNPDVSRRAENIRKEQDQVKETAQARTNTNVTRANIILIRSIIKRLETLVIPVRHYAVVNNKGGEINDLLKDRVHAYTIGVNSNSKEQTVVATNTTQTCAKDKVKPLTNLVQTKITKLADQSEA